MSFSQSIVKKENREEYISSLAASLDSGDPRIFIDFMMNHHKTNLLKQIEEYKQSIQNETKIQKKKHSTGWTR